MALEKPLNTEFGFTANEAYFKIDDIQISSKFDDVRVNIRGFVSKEARDMETSDNFIAGIYKKQFTYKLSSYDLTDKRLSNLGVMNLIKTISYEKLILEEEFNNATSV